VRNHKRNHKRGHSGFPAKTPGPAVANLNGTDLSLLRFDGVSQLAVRVIEDALNTSSHRSCGSWRKIKPLNNSFS
jgi:hypothetical protein